MYEVKIFDDINDNLGTLIHSPFPNKVKLSAGNINQIIKGISNGSITINPNNPGWGKIKSMKTLIQVKDIKRNKIVFKGRILKPTYIMTNNGMFSIEYAIESELAYLNDSNQRFGEYHNISVREFFTVIIENHNRQVEPHKQFKVGNVTVMDSNDSLYRYLGYEKTFATIKDKLIDRLGGYLVIREEFDGNYIDYLAEIGEYSSTEIRLRKNLKDMQREIDPNGIITRLIPLGARIESDDEQATDASQARIDIKEVNGGIDYLDDLELIKEFGVIEGILELDEITDKSVIKTRGQQFLSNQKAAKITYSLTPVDVSLIDQSFDELKVGNRHKVINEVFGINEELQIIEKNIDLLNPVKVSLTIGEKYQTLTQYQVDARKQVRNVEKLERQVTAYSNKIGTISEELTSTKQTLQQTQEQLQNFESVTDGDIAVISQSVTELLDAVESLEDTVTNMPTAQLAWFDKDGLMSKNDFNKLYYISQSSNSNDFSYYDFGVNIRYAFEVIDSTLSEGSGSGNGYYYLANLLEEMARKIDAHEFKIARLEGGQ